MKTPKARATWGWLAVFVLAAAAILWQAVRPPASVEHDAHDGAVALLISVAEASWSAVELLGPGGMERFERDASGRWLHHGAVAGAVAGAAGSEATGDAASAAAVEAATEAASEATRHEHRADPASAERIASVFGALARTRIERTLPGDPARLTAYGLDRPEWIVLIHGADRRPLSTIEVGQIAPDRLSRYVRLPLDGRVLTIANYQIEGLIGLTASAPISSAPAR